MSDITRSEALKELKEYVEGLDMEYATPFDKAILFAIASLETDEAYNLMYEQPEFCKDTLSRKELLKKWEETTPRGRTEFDQIIMSMSSVLPKATKNDCENCIHNKGVLECDMYGCKYESTTKNETLVSLGAYKQVAWERDIAIEQLHELGYEFGQKIESTTKNDSGVDAISRQEAIDTIRQLYLDLASQKAVIDILKVLPSVTPIRPKGHWIGHREHCENLGVIPSGLGAYEWCSNCDCGIDVREWHSNHYNYCPNCGSRNEVEE